jgi:two-component system nitrogen regulation response regulator NtrX
LEEIMEERFRRDLYHRLNVVPIEIPPLSARLDDIPRLARHFVQRLNAEQGLPARRLTDELLTELQTYDWPGNVRQLRNLVERLLIMGGREDGAIGLDDLPTDMAAATEAAHGLVGGNLASLPLRQAREVFERDYLVAQINRFGGNISRTANFVGMERSALHRKLKMLGVMTTSRGGARIAVAAEEEEDA